MLRDVSKACSSTCCSNPFVGLPRSNTVLTSQILRHEFEVCIANSLYPNSQFTNHESLPSFDDSFACFNKVYPQYSQTEQSDKIRAREYNHLSLSRHVCLDYIGHGLFSYSQLQSSSLSLKQPPFFDISYKSVNLNSQLLESEFQSDIKKRIMAFMNVSEADYSMILTVNQSSAFKVLSDCYPFQSSHENLLTVYDYQNEAVELMIESSKKRGANVMSADFTWPNLEIQSEKLRKKMVSKSKYYKRKGLFVFPLQSRVTGLRYSYQWMSLARENGWDVLLDASALGAKDMETLGLSFFNPEFIICSFFKVFGDNPSGFCCLFIKKSIASILIDSTNVGIVNLVHQVIDTPRIECRGLDHADSLGLILISTRTRYLINWLVNALMSLKHPNSNNEIPVIKIYGPKVMFDRGPSVAFNVFDWKGERINPTIVQKLADRNNISLSIGFLQYIWFSDKHEEQKVLERRRRGAEGTMLSKKRDKFCNGISVVTASLNFLTDFEDIYRVWAFVSRFLDADFLEKEKWRYKALNQETVEV